MFRMCLRAYAFILRRYDAADAPIKIQSKHTQDPKKNRVSVPKKKSTPMVNICPTCDTPELLTRSGIVSMILCCLVTGSQDWLNSDNDAPTIRPHTAGKRGFSSASAATSAVVASTKRSQKVTLSPLMSLPDVR